MAVDGTNRTYLLGSQYRDGANLTARMSLHERFSVNSQGWLRWLFEQLDLAPYTRVLEVGSGLATLWRENRDRLPSGWQITLSDLSPGMLSEARRALGDDAVRCRWALADAQALPFRDGSFDTVIANHMLYHVPDRPAAISELRRVVARGGRLFAATNGVAHLHEIDQLIERVVGPAAVMMSNHFTLESGAEQLARAFPTVELRRYPDALEVTEPEPLLAYVRSMIKGAALTPEQVRALRSAVEDEIARRGSFHIGKDAGLFVAVA